MSREECGLISWTGTGTQTVRHGLDPASSISRDSVNPLKEKECSASHLFLSPLIHIHVTFQVSLEDKVDPFLSTTHCATPLNVVALDRSSHVCRFFIGVGRESTRETYTLTPYIDLIAGCFPHVFLRTFQSLTSYLLEINSPRTTR